MSEPLSDEALNRARQALTDLRSIEPLEGDRELVDAVWRAYDGEHNERDGARAVLRTIDKLIREAVAGHPDRST